MKRNSHSKHRKEPLTASREILRLRRALLRMTTGAVLTLTGCTQITGITADPVVSVVSEIKSGVYQVSANGGKLDNWGNIYGDAVRAAQDFCQPVGQTVHVTAVEKEYVPRVLPQQVTIKFICQPAG